MKNLINLLFIAGMVMLQSCGTSLRLSSGSLPVYEEERVNTRVEKKVKPSSKKSAPVVASLEKNTVTKPIANKPTAQLVKPAKNTDKKIVQTENKTIPLTANTVNYHSTGKASMIISNAKTYLNTPYRMGGTNYAGIDCSALVMQSYKTQGINLPRTADAQATTGIAVSLQNVQAGDLLFFYSSQPGVVGHSGLVVSVENGVITFIHAALTGVRYDNMDSPHWKKHFISARRVIM